jgi:hypothetical protein
MESAAAAWADGHLDGTNRAWPQLADCKEIARLQDIDSFSGP